MTYYDTLYFTICHHSPFLVAAQLVGLHFAFECGSSIQAKQIKAALEFAWFYMLVMDLRFVVD